MTLDSIEYREVILDGCLCEISYYQGDSYVTIKKVCLNLRKHGKVTDSYLLGEIHDMRKNLLLHDLNVR